MKRSWFAVFGLVLVCAAATVARAEDTAPPRDQVDDLLGRYNLQPAFDKGGRGLANFAFGWLEIPLNAEARYSQSDTAGSFIAGVGVGVVKGVVRTVVGAYEAVTFFLPYPEDFRPILPTLPYFQKTPGRRRLPLE